MKVSRYLRHLARFSDKACRGGIESFERVERQYLDMLKSLIAVSDEESLKVARDELANERFKMVF